MGRVELAALLIASAKAEGFPLAGVIDIDLAPLGSHVESYDEWLRRGFAGAMSYLERGRDRRADPRLVFPKAQSVLCVAIPYPRGAGGSGDPARGPRYARYLQGPDYHEEIAARLERAMARAKLAHPELEWKVCVDTSAVLERGWATLAGLGWIGKNTMLIHPKLGSYLFIGEVLVSEATGQGPAPLPDYCGNCTRCLQGCPTGAFTRPRQLDANRCVSYWTLEKRGSLAALSEGDRRGVGTWVAGCDICQEVCPFNVKPARDEAPAAARLLETWSELLAETAAAYRERVSDSALSRVKPAQFSRNLAIALGNALREHGADLAPLVPEIRRRLAEETDPDARAEWIHCVDAIG